MPKSYSFSAPHSPPPLVDLEEAYSIPSDSRVSKDRFVILSGCSGSGKSTLLNELCKRGFLCIPEPGRQIVKEQMSIGGDGLPGANPLKFTDLTLSRYLFSFNSTQESPSWVFFDRGLPDALSYIEFLQKPVPAYLQRAVDKFRYNSLVFITPPWREIYRNDSERLHSYEEAVAVYNILIQTYKKNGYEVILVPQGSPQERADFILTKLKTN